ncbi:hypothetical protein F2Q69_00019959 [Brassica cretica]|uniref:Uncharacterized protein n=1 Tax=Brassica cretica TaxID=69181 RepID=A0A8S9QG40_BRACR|nr:hypothetical protein F2Q69_00019959 [Brassica cretica]
MVVGNFSSERRLDPQLPSSYTGNAVLTAYAKAKRKALLEEPFGTIVEMVGEGANRITDEYARSEGCFGFIVVETGIFGDIDGDSKGVYVLAALPSKEMTKFLKWFEDTLC